MKSTKNRILRLVEVVVFGLEFYYNTTYENHDF